MEDELYLVSLYDCYSKLLTDKQRLYFEDYYFNNLTLSEMSENYEVSRNAVHKQLKEVSLKLEDFESKLKIKEKNNKLIELSNKLDSNIKDKIEEIINLNN